MISFTLTAHSAAEVADPLKKFRVFVRKYRISIMSLLTVLIAGLLAIDAVCSTTLFVGLKSQGVIITMVTLSLYQVHLRVKLDWIMNSLLFKISCMAAIFWIVAFIFQVLQPWVNTVFDALQPWLDKTFDALFS